MVVISFMLAVRGLPAILYRRSVGGRRAAAAGLPQAITLTARQALRRRGRQLRMHNGDMPDGRRGPVREALTSVTRSVTERVTERVKRWRGHPPEEAGVREPRRPRPNLPAASVALDEPRIALYRRLMKQNRGHGMDRP